jgi:hypothetical protein
MAGSRGRTAMSRYALPLNRLIAYGNTLVWHHPSALDMPLRDAYPATFDALEAVLDVVVKAEHHNAPIFGDDIRDAILDNIPEVTP